MALVFLPRLFILLLAAAVLVVMVVNALKKGNSGVKVMLLGIHITLFGGILAIDANTNFNGIEYLVVLIGLVISLAGLRKQE